MYSNISSGNISMPMVSSDTNWGQGFILGLAPNSIMFRFSQASPIWNIISIIKYLSLNYVALLFSCFMLLLICALFCVKWFGHRLASLSLSLNMFLQCRTNTKARFLFFYCQSDILQCCGINSVELSCRLCRINAKKVHIWHKTKFINNRRVATLTRCGWGRGWRIIK